MGKKIVRRVSWLMTLGLVVIWLMLWGNISVQSVLIGIIIALGIQLAFPLPVIPEVGRIRPLGVLKLIMWTLGGLVTASIELATQILAFKRPIKHAVICVNLRTKTDFITALTSELVTLVPGSVVVDSIAGELVVHVFRADSPEDIDSARRQVLAQEALVIGAFGSAEERALLAKPKVVAAP